MRGVKILEAVRKRISRKNFVSKLREINHHDVTKVSFVINDQNFARLHDEEQINTYTGKIMLVVVSQIAEIILPTFVEKGTQAFPNRRSGLRHTFFK
jgi:hypothetical protein